MLELRNEDYEDWQATQLLTQTCTNQIISWLMCSWNTFGAQTNHSQTRIHKIHHDPNLGETTTFPLIVFCACPRGQHPNVILSRDSQVGVLKFLKLGFPRLWRPITLCAYLWWKWVLKQSYSPHQELSKDMWHTTCM